MYWIYNDGKFIYLFFVKLCYIRLTYTYIAVYFCVYLLLNGTEILRQFIILIVFFKLSYYTLISNNPLGFRF